MTKPTTAPARPAPPIASPFGALAQRLGALLTALSDTHESMEQAFAQQRDAMRKADPNAFEQAAHAHRTCLEALMALDQQRRTLVADAVSLLPPLGRKPATQLTLTEIAATLPVNDRARLVEQAKVCRQTIERVHTQQRTLRGATLSLLAHMEGVMRQVARSLSHAGTYTRKGFVEAGTPVVSSLDLQT